MNIIQSITSLFKSEETDNSIPARFDRFHAQNPHVYECLVSLARQVMARNRGRKIGIGMLYEVLRWEYFITTDSKDEYKLPNEFRACYARKIMEENSDLAGCFHIRKSIADK